MSANNMFILHGRISNDLVVKGVDKKAYMFFNVASSRVYNGKTETDFLFCKAFGGTAEFIAKWFKKGSPIALEGEIRTSKGPDDKFATIYLHVNGANFPIQNKADGTGAAKGGAKTSSEPSAEPSSAFNEQDEQDEDAPQLDTVSDSEMPF
jgi:single-strand DNA-binding protein